MVCAGFDQLFGGGERCRKVKSEAAFSKITHTFEKKTFLFSNQSIHQSFKYK
jgi:hypothetical protein